MCGRTCLDGRFLYLHGRKNLLQLAKHFFGTYPGDSLLGSIHGCSQSQGEFVAGSVFENVIVPGIGLLHRVFDFIERNRADCYFRGRDRSDGRVVWLRKRELRALRRRQVRIHAYVEEGGSEIRSLI